MRGLPLLMLSLQQLRLKYRKSCIFSLSFYLIFDKMEVAMSGETLWRKVRVSASKICPFYICFVIITLPNYKSLNLLS